MKLFEEFTREDLWKLRKEILLNSVYESDYRNSFFLNEKSVCEFFDGYVSYLTELEKEDGLKLDIDQFFGKYDNEDNLERWYGCFESFDWVKYDLLSSFFDCTLGKENSFEIQLSKDDVSLCCHQGDCQSDVEAVIQQKYIRNQLDKISNKQLVVALVECGVEDVEQFDRKKMESYIVWIAAGDISDTERI